MEIQALLGKDLGRVRPRSPSQEIGVSIIAEYVLPHEYDDFMCIVSA